MKILKITLLAIAVAHTPAFAFNKCTDANGKITFTDTACPQALTWTNPPPATPPEELEAPHTPPLNSSEPRSSRPAQTPGKEPANEIEIEAAEKLIAVLKSKLKDPDSAKFRGVKIAIAAYDIEGTKSAYAICGEYNAKNSFGGYGGFEGFVVENNIHGEPTVLVQSNEILGAIWQIRAKEMGCL